MQLYQIINEVNKACHIAVCSASPLGSGRKKEETLKAFDELKEKLNKINNS